MIPMISRMLLEPLKPSKTISKQLIFQGKGNKPGEKNPPIWGWVSSLLIPLMSPASPFQKHQSLFLNDTKYGKLKK